jgi:hypothetical protein
MQKCVISLDASFRRDYVYYNNAKRRNMAVASQAQGLLYGGDKLLFYGWRRLQNLPIIAYGFA